MAAWTTCCDVDRPDVEPQLAADDARHVEQVFDQPQLRRGVSLDDLERVIARFHVAAACAGCASSPSTAFSGVRISCDSVARNSSLSLDASSATVRARSDDENLVAQLALADDPLADVFDDGDRADDPSVDSVSGAMRALCGHVARRRVDGASTTGIRNLWKRCGEHAHFAVERVAVVLVETARRDGRDSTTSSGARRVRRRNAGLRHEPRSSRRESTSAVVGDEDAAIGQVLEPVVRGDRQQIAASERPCLLTGCFCSHASTSRMQPIERRDAEHDDEIARAPRCRAA